MFVVLPTTRPGNFPTVIERSQFFNNIGTKPINYSWNLGSGTQYRSPAETISVYVFVALPSIRTGNVAAFMERAHVFTRSKRNQTFDPDRELGAKTKHIPWKSTIASKYQPGLEIPHCYLTRSAFTSWETKSNIQVWKKTTIATKYFHRMRTSSF